MNREQHEHPITVPVLTSWQLEVQHSLVFFHRYASPTPEENIELPLAFKCSALSTSRLFTLALFLSMQYCIICMCELVIWEVSDSCWDSTTNTDQWTKTVSWKCLKDRAEVIDTIDTSLLVTCCFVSLLWADIYSPYISITLERLMLLKNLICN